MFNLLMVLLPSTLAKLGVLVEEPITQGANFPNIVIF